MPARSPKKRKRRTSSRSKTKIATRGNTAKQKRTVGDKPKAKKRSKKKRSSAAKKGWAKRRKRDKLLRAMRAKGWEPIDRDEDLFTKGELYDHLQYIADEMEIDVSDVYRMYYGYPGRGDT